MDSFTDLKFQENRLRKNIAFLSKPSQEKILKAYNLAKKCHQGQVRDEGGKYVIHGLRVASLVIENLKITNISVICAAILHDTVEDTTLKIAEIKKEFGNKTANLVNGVTRKKLPDETPLNKYERKYKAFLNLLKKSLEIRLLKTCDWLDNLNSWPRIHESHPSRKKFDRWTKEAGEMYIPLAKTVDQKIAEEMSETLKRFR